MDLISKLFLCAKAFYTFCSHWIEKLAEIITPQLSHSYLAKESLIVLTSSICTKSTVLLLFLEVQTCYRVELFALKVIKLYRNLEGDCLLIILQKFKYLSVRVYANIIIMY